MKMSDYKQIQLGVDSIIGTRSIIRRRKKSSSDKKRELFFNLINSIEELNVRQNIMYADLDLDFANYDEKFFTVIDMLIYMNFGKQCTDIIAFYLYERINPDGTLNSLIVGDGEELILNNPYELWNLMCQVNPKLND
jgi:hypothetical protein